MVGVVRMRFGHCAWCASSPLCREDFRSVFVLKDSVVRPSDARRWGLSAYRACARGERRYSWLVDEAVEVHPREADALQGKRPPHLFRWLGRWHRIHEVASIWRDGRVWDKAMPGKCRTYIYVSCGIEGFFEMYYDGVWKIHRKVETRP